MTKRGLLLAAIIILAVSWLSQRADRISQVEEEEGATPVITPSNLPLFEEEEVVIKPDTSPYEGEVGPPNGGTGEVKSAAANSVVISRVIDGDTVTLEDGRKLRYLGIDAPELHNPKKSVQCFSQESTQKNKELVEGKTVQLVKDVSETDKYGRLLRYVYVDGVFVNDWLVREGYAHAYPWPPDVAFRDQLRQAQAEAKLSQKGLWGTCG